MLTNRIHTAPWLQIKNKQILVEFCSKFGILPHMHTFELVDKIAYAFRHIPYENLTKIVKADSVMTASSAMRYPDEVLQDFLTYSTGGTCFSLTAAMIAMFDALGLQVYPVLADRHYGINTHCAVMIPLHKEMYLLDPGYLLYRSIKIPTQTPVVIDNGFNHLELKPVDNLKKVELYTIVKKNRKLRLTFKIDPVSDDTFRAAWEQSFAFEMMTYPILTCMIKGNHHYLQGNVLSIRNAEKTQRFILTPEKQIDFIESAGINRNMISKALEIVKNGKFVSAS